VTGPHDPGADPEDEGIPDLQDGTPEAQEANDPLRLPVAGDRPTVAMERDTTVNEAIGRDPLERRLADEAPEPDPRAPAEEGEEPEGMALDDTTGGDMDETAENGGPAEEREDSRARTGLTAEEAAMHVVAEPADENGGTP
jgi:hypothetical protein